MKTRVTYRAKESVASIVMDDGKANALSPQMLSELNGALNQAEADGATVVLSGRPGMFSAGFDLKILTAGGADAERMLAGGFELAQRLLSFPAPVVIACSGHALAMGAFLLLSGDYRIGVDGAYKIGANEVAIGMVLPRTAIEICRQRLAPAHFNRALINAEIYAPADALTAGFLDRVVGEPELQTVVADVAAKLSKLNMPAHAATKRLARGHSLNAIRSAFEADEKMFRTLMG